MEQDEELAGQEVRSEELGQGVGAPLWQSPLPPEAVEALRQPLDPNRVRRRKGRGGGSFEYLAGHDVKRRANEIFGFGNWGSRLVRLEETAAVEVSGDKGTSGWHISYLAVVEVTVRGCLPFSDVGYGDGVEYGPAAFATARELATKEASTDSLKRALTGWGDQMGLVLYALADERKRIVRDVNAGQATRVQEGPPVEFPASWAAIGARIAAVVGGEDDAREWITQGREALLGKPWGEALREEKDRAFQAFSTVTVDLERLDLDFSVGVRGEIQKVLAHRLGGVVVEGPGWSLDPGEAKAGRPVRRRVRAGENADGSIPGMAEKLDAAGDRVPS